MKHTQKQAHLSVFLLVLALGITHNATLIAQNQPHANDHAQSAVAASVENKGLLNVKLNTIDGHELELSVYRGKVIVVVNTASRCGFTSQYKELQQLHKEYREQGLVVLGFPCDQFGGLEPDGNEVIAKFCKEKFGVTFKMFAKSNVNGDKRNELFKWLCGLELQPKGKGDVNWNFEKFVVGRDGHPVGRFAARVSPTDDEFVDVLKQELAKTMPADTAAEAVEKK